MIDTTKEEYMNIEDVANSDQHINFSRNHKTDMISVCTIDMYDNLLYAYHN